MPALAKDENAATAIRVRIELPRAQLTIDENAATTIGVRIELPRATHGRRHCDGHVMARNYGKKTWTVPTDTCAPALQIYE